MLYIIEIPVPSQAPERWYICVWRVYILLLFTTFVLKCGTVPTVVSFVVHWLLKKYEDLGMDEKNSGLYYLHCAYSSKSIRGFTCSERGTLQTYKQDFRIITWPPSLTKTTTKSNRECTHQLGTRLIVLLIKPKKL